MQMQYILSYTFAGYKAQMLREGWQMDTRH
jgi:hypothetical protein